MKRPEHAVDTTEHCWIPMPDGVRLSARIWCPNGEPAPAILEYIPYRKRDMVRARDARNHPYFAAHGYACLRVDMRGSGDSEGVMPDMYAPDELADARHVIHWIASQPWCNGRVGMFGTSWGGTSSLQAAVAAPEPLKAVIANCATTDRFEDDIHWMGGCLLTDSLEWGATLPAILAAPPDAATVGDGWREMWRARLAQLSHPLERWMQNRTRGNYWRRGSVQFQAKRLTCPVLSIGGWADRYANSVMRLVSARPDLCWGIVGPWGHHYPDHGAPGPAISFQDVALDWWDHWLKRDGIAPAPWPRLRLWQRSFDPPQDRVAHRSGAWIEMDAPPKGVVRARVLGRDLWPNASSTSLQVPADPAHGAAAGDTGYFGRLGGLPLDQAPDDARGLCLDTSPLQQPLDLVGAARLVLDLRQARPAGQLVCRMCDVAPDGRSNLVTRTLCNLALDENLDRPLTATQPRVITFPTTAYRFPPGHRLRLVLSQSYWPLAWPSVPAAMHVSIGETRLELPGLPASAQPLRVPFPDAEPHPTAPSWTSISDGALTRSPQVLRDGVLYSAWHQPAAGARFPDLDLSITAETKATYSINAQPGAPAECRITVQLWIQRPDGAAEVTSRVHATGLGEDIAVEAALRTTWDGAEEHAQIWRYSP